MRIDKEAFYYLIIYIFLTFLSVKLVIFADIYHGELDIYIPHYLSDKTLVSKVFDPLCELDLTRTFFRGRELGSLINYLDVQILLYTFKIHIPIIISTIYYITIAIISYISINVIKNIAPKQIKITYLINLLLLTCPSIVFGGIFYRDNKIITSLGIFITIIFLALKICSQYIEIRKKLNWANDVVILSGSIIACFSDEQGFIFIVLIEINLIILYIFYKFKLFKEIIIVGLPIILYYIYINYVGLYIFEISNAIIPKRVTFEINELLNWTNFKESNYLFYRYISYLFGNFLLYGYIGKIIFISVLVYAMKIAKGIINFKKILPILILNYVFIVIVINIMTIKHHAIFWKDIFTYYSLPIILILYSAFIIFSNYTIFKEPKIYKKFFILISIFIIFNLISLNSYKNLLINGHLKLFRNAHLIVKSVYLSEDQAKNIINQIAIKGFVSGLVPNTNYGEESVISIKKSLVNSN